MRHLVYVDTSTFKESTLCPKVSKIGIVNCQCVSNKGDNIRDYMLELDLDILFLTESWLQLRSVDNSVIANLILN